MATDPRGERLMALDNWRLSRYMHSRAAAVRELLAADWALKASQSGWGHKIWKLWRGGEPERRFHKEPPQNRRRMLVLSPDIRKRRTMGDVFGTAVNFLAKWLWSA
jgi:hypothetical protein